jgi:hypothetical protein
MAPHSLNLPHVRQNLFGKPGYPLSAGEIGEAELEMVATGGFTFFELLYELVRGAVDGAFFAEERAFPGDLFGLLLGIGDCHTGCRPRLGDVVEVPANGVAVFFQHVQLVREIVDRATLKIPPEGVVTISPCAGRRRNSPLLREPNWLT